MTETCIWCGHELVDDTMHENVYACGSVQHPRSDAWSQSEGCMEIMQSRERIKRAVEVLETAVRRDFIVGYSPYMEKRSYMEYEQAEQAIAILKGEEDESAN